MHEPAETSSTQRSRTRERISVDVTMTIVGSGQEQAGMDTLYVVSGPGRAHVEVTLSGAINMTSAPDTGWLFTVDDNPGGIRATAAHETGHLMGLRDLVPRDQVVPYRPEPGVDIMHYGQFENSPLTAFMVLRPLANRNTVVSYLGR